uniref:hypothetical protein n=2 Tax=uncultured Desulfovibrio sp. TaxID=167968 RepID=UPI002637E4B1
RLQPESAPLARVQRAIRERRTPAAGGAPVEHAGQAGCADGTRGQPPGTGETAMIALDPLWGGLDVVQDTPPGDALAISFAPSIVSDVTAAVPQLDSQASVQSFMQDQFRASAENMYDSGLVVSTWS